MNDTQACAERITRMKGVETDLAACLDRLDRLKLAVIAAHVDLGHAQLIEEIARAELLLGQTAPDAGGYLIAR